VLQPPTTTANELPHAAAAAVQRHQNSRAARVHVVNSRFVEETDLKVNPRFVKETDVLVNNSKNFAEETDVLVNSKNFALESSRSRPTTSSSTRQVGPLRRCSLGRLLAEGPPLISLAHALHDKPATAAALEKSDATNERLPPEVIRLLPPRPSAGR